MQRIIVNLQNFVFSEAIERALRSDGDFNVTIVERPQEVSHNCQLMAANALLMEVSGYAPWRLEDRIQIRHQIKQNNPDCKVILLVDENSEKTVAQRVKQAKREGLIDLFIYGSTSTNFLVALLDTL